MSTCLKDSDEMSPMSEIELQRRLEWLLAHGNAAEREGRNNDAQSMCDEIMHLLAYARAEGICDADYQAEVWSRATLLCANVAAHASTELTDELRGAYYSAIAAARAVRVGGTHEGRAHRAYGAVLAYYGWRRTAIAHLKRAFKLLARADDGDVLNPRFFEPEIWIMTGTQLAEVLVESGRETEAIRILMRTTRLLSIDIETIVKTTHADDLEAGALLATLLWRNGITVDAHTWRKRVVARAKEIDPTGKDPRLQAVWALRKGLRSYSAYLRTRPRRLRI